MSDGVTIQSDKSASQISWDAYTSAQRLKDGFLLFQGPHLFNWLPFAAIVEGSVEDAESLLRDNVADYKSG
ncbi:MAG TPA: YcxB family protein [Chthoniobacteraceae bacterium]